MFIVKLRVPFLPLNFEPQDTGYLWSAQTFLELKKVGQVQDMVKGKSGKGQVKVLGRCDPFEF